MRLLALYVELTLGMPGVRYRAAMRKVLGPNWAVPNLKNQGIRISTAPAGMGQYTYHLADLPMLFAWAEATGAFTPEELMELEPLVVLELAGG